MNRSTPSSPSRANARRSVIRPSSGSWSILKSPVCSTVPAPVRIATASASGMEWLTATNSRSNGPKLDRVALLHDVLHGLLEPVLAQLGGEQRQRELGADQRDVAALAQEVRHRADVVLVAVGEHQRLDLVEPVPDRVEVGQDQVDAGVVVLGEQHAAVDDQQPAVVLEDGHVAADVAEAAERDDPQALVGQRSGRGQVGVRAAHGSSFVGSAGPRAARRRAAPSRRWATSVVVGGHQRQPHGAVAQHAEQLQRRLGGHRALRGGHHGLDDRDELAVGRRARRRGRRRSTASTIGGVLVAGDVADDRDDAAGAVGEPAEVEHVVAGVERQPGARA